MLTFLEVRHFIKLSECSVRISLHGMLRGNGYHCMDMEFWLLYKDNENVTAKNNNPRLTDTRTSYCHLICDAGSDKKLTRINDSRILLLRKNSRVWKENSSVVQRLWWIWPVQNEVSPSAPSVWELDQGSLYLDLFAVEYRQFNFLKSPCKECSTRIAHKV